MSKANYVPGHYHSHSHEQKNASQKVVKKANTSLPRDGNVKAYDSNPKQEYSVTMMGQLSKSSE